MPLAPSRNLLRININITCIVQLNWSRPVQCLLTPAGNFYRYYKALLSICLIVRTAISNRLGWCYKKEVGGNDMKTLERLITLAV